MSMSPQAPVTLALPAKPQGSPVLLWTLIGFGLVFLCALLMWASFGPEIYISMLTVVASCF
jgi:hypothetical protein